MATCQDGIWGCRCNSSKPAPKTRKAAKPVEVVEPVPEVELSADEPE